MSWAYFKLGRYPEALDLAREALAEHGRIGYVTGQADVLDTMGQCCQHLGHHAEARRYFRRPEGLYASVGDRYYHALGLARTARMHVALGDAAQAGVVRASALAAVEGLGIGDDDPIHEELRG